MRGVARQSARMPRRCTEMSPVISYIESGSAAEASGAVRPGDVVLGVGGIAAGGLAFTAHLLSSLSDSQGDYIELLVQRCPSTATASANKREGGAHRPHGSVESDQPPHARACGCRSGARGALQPTKLDRVVAARREHRRRAELARRASGIAELYGGRMGGEGWGWGGAGGRAAPSRRVSWPMNRGARGGDGRGGRDRARGARGAALRRA